eukprot:TRINITY_DN3803_c2_g1_i2.p1 TRINITY_DN3803_c2_g1~~TRINITY_DN3803_c2_g1_i2.p1  ORF type:complete len:1048 (-),score=219.55 TRINITY_DN3803_c2_g1_i2:306-3035(-)
MSTEQSAFISALAKFCSVSVEEVIQNKHLVAIKTLIDIALEDGNYLRGSWATVLRVLSQLDRMHHFASGTQADLLEDNRQTTTTLTQSTNSDQTRKNEIYESNAKLIAKNITMATLDSVYSISNKLTNSGFLEMVSGLCLVSVEEMEQEKPSVFSLKQMVEIAVDNLRYRIRIVWNRMWKMLANHFTFAGLHKNRKISILGIDSLRLVSSKFLEFEELANYNFQKEFLKPFEVISKTRNRAVREYVVECLCTMINALPQNIKSGWASILSVFASQALLQSNEVVVKRSFEITRVIVTKYFSHVSKHYFGDLVDTVGAYASSKRDSGLSLEAIRCLEVCAKKLSAQNPKKRNNQNETRSNEISEDSERVEKLPGEVEFESDNPEDVDDKKKTVTTTATSTLGIVIEDLHTEIKERDKERWYGQWLSLVNVLVRTILNTSGESRRLALNTMFGILKAEGRSFPPVLWGLLFDKGLWKLFDPLRSVDADTKEEWLLTESSDLFKALHGVLSLFDIFFPSISTHLSDALSLIANFIQSENEHLSTFGTTSLETLLQNNGKNFSPNHWETVCSSLSSVLQKSFISNLVQASATTTATTIATSISVPTSTTTPPTPPTEAGGVLLPIEGSNVVTSDAEENPTDEESYSDNVTSQSEGVVTSDQHAVASIACGKCRVRKQVLHLILDIIFVKFFACLSLESINMLIRSLLQTYTLMNDALSEDSFYDVLLHSVNTTQLVELQCMVLVHSLECYLDCLFRLESDDDRERREISRTYLINSCKSIIQAYMSITAQFVLPPSIQGRLHPKRSKHLNLVTTNKQQRQMELSGSMILILQFMLSKFLNYDDEKFSKMILATYPLLCDLVMSDSSEVRFLVRQVIWRTGTQHLHGFDEPFRSSLVPDVAAIQLENFFASCNR